MSQDVMNLVEKSSLQEQVPEFEIGDTVDVRQGFHVRHRGSLGNQGPKTAAGG